MFGFGKKNKEKQETIKALKKLDWEEKCIADDVKKKRKVLIMIPVSINGRSNVEKRFGSHTFSPLLEGRREISGVKKEIRLNIG